MWVGMTCAATLLAAVAWMWFAGWKMNEGDTASQRIMRKERWIAVGVTVALCLPICVLLVVFAPEMEKAIGKNET